MNINQFRNIKVINIEEKLANVQRGSGTFKEILDKVMAGIISPLTNNAGTIIGISFDSKANNLIEDNIEQCKFEKRYDCRPLMHWVLTALHLKEDNKVIIGVTEDLLGTDIKVTTDDGEIIDINDYPEHTEEASATTLRTTETSNEELPSQVDIPADELDESTEKALMRSIKKYLKNTYKHYLSGFAGDPTVEQNEYCETYHISNINWGRKV